MKKLVGVFIVLTCCYSAFSQVNPPRDTIPQTIDTLPIKNPAELIENTKDEQARAKKKLSFEELGLANRSKDHLLIQVGFDGWSGMPDSIQTKGVNRSFNMYLLFDFPFKTNPHISVAVGAGIGSSNMYFSDTYIDIAGKDANFMSFQDVSDTLHFKKYKLLTTYLEAPIELRYTLHPDQWKKSFKAALGLKVGTIIGAGTKGKTLQNSAGATINSYIQKEKTKKYFNSARIAVTARIGFGPLSIFGQYQVNQFIKEGFGPDVKPFAIGLTLAGL